MINGGAFCPKRWEYMRERTKRERIRIVDRYYGNYDDPDTPETPDKTDDKNVNMYNRYEDLEDEDESDDDW